MRDITKLLRLPSATVLLGMLGFVTIIFALSQLHMNTSAAPPPICHTAMVLDRSGSVGDTNETTLKNQILRLFQPTGLYDSNIQLAFWSFSSNNGRSNYDAPFNGFVSSKGVDSNFTTNLNKVVSSGGTDYEQGFGYNNGVINTFDGMDKIIGQTNIIVFMTDGLPNTPGNGDGNAIARSVARTAVLKLKATGKIIIGGIVGDASPGSLNYVINGNDNDSTNLFHISSSYDDLSIKLRSVIGTQCDALFPPQPSSKYVLTPTVTSANNVVTGTDGASFSYSVNNAASDGSSDMVNWTVKRLIVARGQAVDPLYYGNSPYRDGLSCPQLVALVNGKATCSDVTSGQRVFAPGSTSLDTDAAAATNVAMDDQWGVGTKVCYVLTLDKPTWDTQPRDRYSRAACLIVGKRPQVQIHGGDLRVGRHFAGDPAPTGNASDTSPASVQTSVTMKSNGRTYGSWAEYGVFAPGMVVGFASLSGLQGGALTNIQDEWSKLTFANTDNQYGEFTPDNSGQGTIPDTASALLRGRNVTRDLTGTNDLTLSGKDFAAGLYQKSDGNLNLDASTLEPGKTVIVNVPNGTLTITGNLSYSEGPYTDIGQLPQLILIAKNINIDPAVINADAWMITSGAEPDGHLSTCDVQGTLTSEICNQPLMINGPVQARHLDLRRTGGAGAGGAAGDPAEVINLPADAYLWSQSAGGSESRAQTTFTTELPPYF